jgi:PAS domain S-box-containing protein
MSSGRVASLILYPPPPSATEAALRRALEGREQSITTNLVEARAAASRNAASFVVCCLPPDRGRSTLLLSELASARLPFVAVTPPDAPDLEVAALERGALDVIASPFSEGVLAARLRRVARAREIEPPRLSGPQAQRFFEDACAAAACGVSIADVRHPEQPLVYVNPAFERLTGYASAEVLGRNCRFLQVDEPITVERALIRQAIASARPCTVLLRNRKKSGELFWNELTLAPVIDDAGRHVYMIGVQHDVSARLEVARLTNERTDLVERMASAIKDMGDRRRFTESILNEVTMGVITAHPDLSVTFVNRKALEMLRLDTVAPTTLLTNVFAAQPDIVQALLAARPGREQRLETTLPNPAGAIEVGLAVTRSAGSSPDLSYVVLFRDIGSQRQQTNETRRVERLSALGQMAAGFAHEVRNPLAAMGALSESLAAELALDDGRREYVTRIMGLVARMDNLVKSTLRFSQPKGPQMRPTPPPVLIRDALDILGPRLKKLGGGEPQVEVAPDLPALRVDPDQIVEVLLALLDNALDAVGSPQRVRVHAHRLTVADGEGGVAIDLIDDGAGVTPEAMQRIFDPFYTTKPKGIGLGLSIAQRLTAENGGHLRCTSRPGVETRFRLQFPLRGA